MSLSYRRASPADAPLFEAWDREPHVREAVSETGDAGFGADWGAELDDERLTYVVASDGGEPVGFLCIVDPATDPYWSEMPPGLRAIDIVIGNPRALGRGRGTQMMRWALDCCFDDPAVEAVLVDPLAVNAGAIRFYRRLGFREVERQRLGESSDCMILRLDRAAWETP